MGDQDDRFPLVPKTFQDAEQMIRFRRRQHACRFVENEDVRVPEQRFEYFDALLMPHGKIFYDSVRVDV